MNLLRLTSGLLVACLAAALGAPAGADQVFSTVTTGPVYSHATPGPYPLGDIYYAPCGWNGNYGGGAGYGRLGGRGYRGTTTLTGERFYPYDVSSNQNRLHGGYQMNCWRQGYRGAPSPAPHRVPQIRATPTRERYSRKALRARRLTR